MKLKQSMLILTIAAATAGTSVQASHSAMQKAAALGKGFALAGVGFVLFGKGLDAMGTVTQNMVAPGVDRIRSSNAYQNTVGRFFRKPTAASKLDDISKDLKKNTYILMSIVGSIAASNYFGLDQRLKPYLVVGA